MKILTMLGKYPLKRMPQLSHNNSNQVSLPLQIFRRRLKRIGLAALSKKVRKLNLQENKMIISLFLSLIFKNLRHHHCNNRNLKFLHNLIPNLN